MTSIRAMRARRSPPRPSGKETKETPSPSANYAKRSRAVGDARSGRQSGKETNEPPSPSAQLLDGQRERRGSSATPGDRAAAIRRLLAQVNVYVQRGRR